MVPLDVGLRLEWLPYLTKGIERCVFSCEHEKGRVASGRIPLLAGKEKIVEKERRRSPRYPFIATAELVEQSSETRMVSRVSELGLHGCYLDMMNPFPQGTRVL